MATILSLILFIHSWVRWVVLLSGLAGVGKFGLGWLQKQSFTKLDKQILTTFTMSLSVQFVLGLVLITLYLVTVPVSMAVARPWLEHAFTMFIALGVAHATAKWKSAPDNIRFRNYAIAILVSLILIVVGIMPLGVGRWALRGF